MRFCGIEKYGDLSMPGRTRRTEKTMMEFLRAHQLNIMLFMSGMCGILAFLSLISRVLTPKRRRGAERGVQDPA